MIKLLFIWMVLLSLPVSAQEEAEPDVIDEISRSVTNSPYDNFVTLVFENDVIGRGTDQNYTNGVRLIYHDINAEFSDFVHEIADLVPTFELNRTSSLFYSVGQNLYTPDDISSAVQDPKDRPWAAFLYGSVGMTSVTDNHLDELEVTAGIVGPLALGEQVQKAVHKHITESPVPQGWDNQIKNEPGLILSAQRRWPAAFGYEAAGMIFSVSPYVGASLGNIYTYANGGVGFRLSSTQSEWTDAPLRVRPALAGTGYFDIPEKGWDWYLFGGLEGRAVARNIFLDGNSFRDSHSVDKFPFVGDANVGVAFTFGRARLSYTLVHRSKEFEGQDRADLFGAVNLAYRF